MRRSTSTTAKHVHALARMETGPRHLERWILRLMLIPLLLGMGYVATEMVELWSGVSSVLAQATDFSAAGG